MDDLTLFALVTIGVMVVIDIVIFAIAGKRIKKLNAERETFTQRTVATVVDNIVRYPAYMKGRSSNFPVFEFYVDGRRLEVEYEFGSTPSFKEWNHLGKDELQFPIGSQVEIAYDPANPEHVFVPGDGKPYKFAKSLIWSSVITTAFFAIVIIFCCFVLPGCVD